ncbi:MAG: N-formylglutamate amidohydrolase [Phyllobacterium sp.]
MGIQRGPCSIPEAARVVNSAGRSPVVLLCDHASNHIPECFGALGLSDHDLTAHIAWDPGALGVSRAMSRLLDAPLVESCVSRLIIDCNRPLDAPDLIPPTSERTVIPGNAGLDEAGRQERIALSHDPYHRAIEALVAERAAAGLPEPMFVAVHSFTPVYQGKARPWHIGIIHDGDERLSGPVIAGLQGEKGLCVGINEPYSPADRVYYTLERHGRARNAPCVMIEIRNNLITTSTQEEEWGKRLTRIIRETLKDQGNSRESGFP